MTGLIDLKTLEKRAFRRFYEDGIFDLFLGIMLADMAVGAVVTNWLDSETSGLLVMLGIAVVAVTALIVVRRRLLASRLGEFKPGPGRQNRITLVRLALLGSLLVGLIIFVLAAAGDIPIISLDVLMPLVWFINAVLVFGAMAYLLDVPRFYLYGFLFGSAMPLLVLPDVLWGYRLPPWAALGGPAVVIVAIGIFKLARFLSDYPVLVPPTDD